MNIPTPVEGFAYVLTDVLVEDERLRAMSSTNHIYDSACAIQTPVAVNHERDQEFAVIGESGWGALYPQGNAPYACVAELGYHFSQDGQCFMGTSLTPMSCSKAQLCNNLCECSETACIPKLYENELRFDGALNDSGDRLEGTMVGLEGSGGRATVRLTRVAAP